MEGRETFLIPYDDNDMEAIGTLLEGNSSLQQLTQSMVTGSVSQHVDNYTFLLNLTSNETSTRGASCEPEWHVYLKMVCVPVLATFGLVGNTLSFIVMFSSTYRRKSYSYYLRGLAIFDNLTLLIAVVEVGNDISYITTGHGYFNGQTPFTCKLSEFSRHVIYVMSSWMVVCFTVDRYIAVCHPLQRARLCTERSAKITILVLLIFAMLSQLYLFHFITRLDRDPDEMPCHAPKNIRMLYFGLEYFLFSFMLRFMLPFVVIVVLNSFIIYHIWRMRTTRMTRENEKVRNANLAIYTLFVVCAVFVITLLPNAVISMMMFISMIVYQSKELYCPLLSFNAPCQMVRLLNYSVNFCLYGLSGRRFRRELHRLPRTLHYCLSRQRETASESFKLQHRYRRSTRSTS